MDWANEEYVRLYVRETADDLELSWEAIALWRALLTKFDRSGLITVRNGWMSVARLVRMPEPVVERAGAELVADGRVRAVERGFLAPNFTEAQTASKSDKLRQRESRDRRRADAMSQAIDSAKSRHEPSQAVTSGHAPSRNVTLALASAEPIPPVAEPLLIPRDGHAENGKTAKPRAVKCRLPDDWSPVRSTANLAAEAAARSRGVDLDLQLANMRDWARANGARKADWEATWRNWTRNAKPSGAFERQRQTPLEQQLERVRMLEAEESAGKAP